jgi:hypothetical protein
MDNVINKYWHRSLHHHLKRTTVDPIFKTLSVFTHQFEILTYQFDTSLKNGGGRRGMGSKSIKG